MSPVRTPASEGGEEVAAAEQGSSSAGAGGGSTTTTTTTGPLTKIIVLVSSIGGSAKQSSDQRRCRDLFNAKGLLFEELDGGAAHYRDLREFLWGLSKERTYPQIYLESGGEKYKHVGNWQTIQELLDTCDMPPEFLEQHPEIRTFDKVFAAVPKGKPTHNLSTVW
ncbi:hypothetical protein JKP88DRAFT_351161 [Tribonema minus]|uniref:Uncharacterized protein n=1 Tax=Tribonema minus TaxID=303371 RepID=A0A835YM95_9STRA|nr:hypothetical protein JKP88DRAFT_351161 [Tribonema minus]|eukprot:TRINITY_DN11440_c0_g1_i2.p1 TRINITY_DN11440_c0_g1~~TRINITY_DN11440_c0_g1_i2.p1  ORF type:complete len:166 (+),score=22.26 TRINITY_DN11440_c0_g1_i2:205-702(+)